MAHMPTCHLQLKVKSKTECSFSMYRLFLKIKHLPPLSTLNLPLVEFIYILTALYHLAISLILFTHSIIDILYHHLPKKQVKPKNSFVADHLLFCNHSTSYDDFSIPTRENEKILLELKERLLIVRDKPSLNRNITSKTLHLFDKASNKIFLRILFVLIVATLYLFNGLFCYFHYLVICKCMSTTVHFNDTVQFTFFLVMILNITIIRNCNSLIVILVT